MSPTTTKRWGDDADDDDEVEQSVVETLQTSGGSSAPNYSASGTTLSSPTIPPTHISRIDSKGIKIVTSYRANPSNPQTLVKTVTKIRVYQVKIREHVSVEKRRTWKKFGQAVIDGDDQTNVTIQSNDDIYLEDPHADIDLQEEDVTKALAGNLNAFWDKQRRRQVERKYGVGEDAGEVKDDAAAAEASNGWRKVGGDKQASANASGGATMNKYVPPSARGNPGSVTGGAGGNQKGGSLAAMASRMGDKPDSRMQDNRDQNTIRVTNISEDTTEADLQELFGRFGRISRVYVAKDKETMQSRGFAFVSFTHRDEAAKAMEKLQGYGYDHLILKLEWARPSAPKDSTTYRSGYGQALAQDTKAKVSYASNLTR